MRTQVGIVGSGPAGLLLAQLLHLRGIETVILERRSRAYVEGRIRAGVLEQGTVALLNEAGVGERMRREGLVHEGIRLSFGGRLHRIDFKALVGGAVTVYGQTEVTKDLIEARLAAGGQIVFEAEDVSIHGFDGDGRRSASGTMAGDGSSPATSSPAATAFTASAARACRRARSRTYERVYPFAWLGMLVEAPPVCDELIYAHHERGFALFSMRSPTR